MASPFDNLTLAEIQQRLASHRRPSSSTVAASEAEARATLLDSAAENDAFYAGDHWQSGAGWVGPQPPVGEPESAQVLAEIKRAFVSKNTIKEVVNRHRDGVVGREPAWSLTVRRPLDEGEKPKREEQKRIKEAEAVLTDWWDKRKLLKLIQKVVVTLLKSERASLRIFVPSGMLQTTDPTTGEATLPLVPVSDLAASLGRIYVTHPTAAQAEILTDEDTQQQASVYVYEKSGQSYAELSYVDLDTGQTVLRIIGGETEQVTRLDLGGQLLLFEVTRAELISEQIRQLQKQLNLAKTMEGRNVVQGGFLERVILNAQMPGSWVDDPNGTLQPDGTRKTFKASSFKIGAGRTNFLAGQPIRDEKGHITGYANPSVVYRDPVSPETFEMTADAAYRAILEEAQQLHALIGGDATASGESRKQARGDYKNSLLTTKSEIDGLIRWLLEIVLALGAIFSGKPGYFADLRASCDCRIDVGPLTGDEEQSIINQVEAELLDDETAMSRLGVEDVAAAKARIAARRAEKQAEAIALAQATKPATTNDQEPTTNDQRPKTDDQQGQAPQGERQQ